MEVFTTLSCHVMGCPGGGLGCACAFGVPRHVTLLDGETIHMRTLGAVDVVLNWPSLVCCWGC